LAHQNKQKVTTSDDILVILQKIRFFIKNLTILGYEKTFFINCLGGSVTKHRLIGHKVRGFESRLVRLLFAQSKNFCIMQKFFTLQKYLFVRSKSKNSFIFEFLMPKNPGVQKISLFGALFDNSKNFLKRGFLALTTKINFSTLRIENFVKITSPIDSPHKITYMHVHSSRFEMFFQEKTADARFLPINHVFLCTFCLKF
jgi:hypothetical protein